MNRMCREIQMQLPALVAGALPGWRRRLVELHVRGCADCRAERVREESVEAALDAIGGDVAVEAHGHPPPEGLLDTILEQAQRPGFRGRAAVPARGAVSGARPALSIALLLAAAGVGTSVGYATWRIGCALVGRIRAPSRR